MTAKLTDESVAKALGWLSLKGYPKWQMRAPDGEIRNCPNFTTSLDAIVAEIEARGLDWCLSENFSDSCGASVELSSAKEKTPALALCAALMAYLKKGKP